MKPFSNQISLLSNRIIVNDFHLRAPKLTFTKSGL